jgi:hypothetical protein
LQEERAHLQEIIRVQESKEIDAERITKERHLLEDALRGAAQQKELCEKAISELEAVHMKRLEEIESIIKVKEKKQAKSKLMTNDDITALELDELPSSPCSCLCEVRLWKEL